MHLWCASCSAAHVLLPTGTIELLPDEPAVAASVLELTTNVATKPESVEPLLAELELEPVGPLSASPASTAELPPVKCPKCAHRQHETDACDKCGLVFAMVPPGTTPWETYPAAAEQFVPQARTLWEAVEARPADEERHETFVSFCRSKGLILFAVTRYRHRVADHPGDKVATRFLERASNDAVAMVSTLQSGREDFVQQAQNVRRWLVVGAAVLATIALILMFRVAATPTGVPLP
jgi:hypothetical protein